MPGRTLRTAVSTLLAGVFLLSLGTETFGWHDCPHHHRGAPSVAGPQDGGAHAGSSADGLAETPRLGEGTDSPHDRGESGPCTCVGNCHGAAASPLPALLTAVPAVDTGIVRVELQPDTRGLPLRHAPYFLPYPNGPPPA